MFVGSPMPRLMLRLRSSQEPRLTKTNLGIATGEIEELKSEV